MNKPFLCLVGLIGAGKSTLAEKLGKVFGLEVFYEAVSDNPYLIPFYGDMKKYSFPLQIWLLNARFAQAQQLIWSGNGGINDRSIYEDSIFAKILMNDGLMSSEDYETYLQLFHNMSNFMRKPTLLIYLKVTPSESMRRIRMRGRGCEQGISLDYLEKLYKEYEEFIVRISKEITVIEIDWSQFATEEEVAEKIREEYSKLSNIRRIVVG